MHLISIITPCYNAANTIRDTIESVLAQTYNNWEMLIIDDCSTDNSSSIIQSYSIQDSRIKYFKTKEPSGSPSAPRNIGIDNAAGDYIAFLDADDIWFPNKLEDQLTYLISHKCKFVYSNYEKINSAGERNNRIILMRKTTNFWDILESCTIPCLTVLLCRECVNGLRFPDTPKEDYVFWISILRRGIIAYNTGQIHALYREQKNSRSSNKIRMIIYQWIILRQIEGVKVIPALYFMLTYIIQAIYKYIK